MITNATIVSIAAAPQRDNDGGMTAAAPAAADIRVFLDVPRRAQLVALADVVSEATAVMMVPITKAGEIVKGGFVRVRLDKADAPDSEGRLYEVRHRTDYVKNSSLDHAEVFLKGGI
ncbi:MAG TPA: hypothetical protein VGF99_19020 [Myxococcota bacterium]